MTTLHSPARPAPTGADRPGYLADTETGLPMPGEPEFASAEDARRHHKQRLAAALRVFAKCGFGEGISGHISVRDPEDPELFWVNPFGVSFAHVKVRDLICVDGTGRVVRGRHPVNPSAFAIHSEIHRLRPDAVAAAHGHSAHSRAMGAIGELLQPIDQEAAAFHQDQVFFDEYEGPSVAVEQGRHMAEALGDKRAILLRHHGLITVGGSVDEAVHWFVTWDSCAQVQLLARAAGTLRPMTEEQAAAARAGFGDKQLGWFSFQLMWAEITAEQPDLLEE